MSKSDTPRPETPLTLEQANELIGKLLDHIAELKDRLKENSGNAAKPPPVTALVPRRQPASDLPSARGAEPNPVTRGIVVSGIHTMPG